MITSRDGAGVDGKIKFLLINPAAKQWRAAEWKSPPLRTRIFRYAMLSSLSVAASMPENVLTRIVDEETEPVDFDTDADLIGISFMTFNAPRAYEIADTFRLQKGKPVILGGYHPSCLPEEAIRHADAVCIGEAEPVMPQLIRDFQNHCVQHFYSNGLADLALLRIPDRGLLRQGLYAAVDAIQATRGCPQACTFCSITSFFHHRFRTRPVESVIEELRSLGKRILFLDDNLTADADYAKDLFAHMIPLRKHWFSQCSVTIADDQELLDLAAASGCKGLFIGFESLEQKNLTAWKKVFTRASDYRRAIDRLHEAGIGVYAGIVLGHDHDTPESFKRTLEFLQESRIDALQATILTPFPNTPLFKDLERQGRIIDWDWAHYDFRHVVFEPLQMSRQMLQAGHDWVLGNFFSAGSVLRRIIGQWSYLELSTIARVTIPLNIGYRMRLKTDGTWDDHADIPSIESALPPLTRASVRSH